MELVVVVISAAIFAIVLVLIDVDDHLRLHIGILLCCSSGKIGWIEFIMTV